MFNIHGTVLCNCIAIINEALYTHQEEKHEMQKPFPNKQMRKIS